MPSRIGSYCAHPPCFNKTDGRYCDEHKPKRIDDRKSAHERGYDYTWAKVSSWYRKQNPLCERCLENGRVRESQLVDHIVPMRVAPERRLDATNFQALCRDCHSEKTEEDKTKYPEHY